MQISNIPNPDMEETEPKRLYQVSDTDSLDMLLPTSATSAEKRDILSATDVIFSGRFEPARVCGIILTLDEKDLRDLREQLYAALCSAVPAVAGRPLSRRVTGNTSALADDCWALGYSASQGMLTHRADNNTLKPAGRDPLPPPGPIRPAAPVPPAISDATTSLEAIIAMQLRLEREVAELRRDKASLDGRLKTMEQESNRLRAENAARDARIAELVTLVEDLLAQDTPSPSQPAAPAASDIPGVEAAEPQDNSAHVIAAPGVNRAPESRPESSTLAADIVAGIDLRALGGAIAAALQWRVGDSDDSESELAAPPTDPRSGQCGPVGPSGRPPAVPLGVRPSVTAPDCSPPTETEPRAPAGPAARRSVVTGAGPTSALVMCTDVSPERPKRKFLLEGFRSDASDRDVRGLVQAAVQTLHNIHPLPRHDAAGSSKTYMIEVDADDEARIMNPSTWPAGLTVRPRPVYRRRRGRTFRAAQPATPDYNQTVLQSAGSSHYQTPGENGEWRGAAASTAAQQRRREAVQHSDATTGYSQGHGEWQVATNRRRRGQNQLGSTGNSTGRARQEHWAGRPDGRQAQHWQQPNYRHL